MDKKYKRDAIYYNTSKTRISKDTYSFLLGVVACAIVFFIGMMVFSSGVIGNSPSAPQRHAGLDVEQVAGNKICLQSTQRLITSQLFGASMKPTSDENSLVILQDVIDPTTLHIGSMISFNYGNISIMHRIVDIRDYSDGIYFITKGDNNKFPDEYKVKLEDINGDVVAIVY